MVFVGGFGLYFVGVGVFVFVGEDVVVWGDVGWFFGLYYFDVVGVVVVGDGGDVKEG